MQTTFPIGWYPIALSSDLKPGHIRNFRYFAKEFTAYRGADNKVRITDPHCPHQGAHLGKGGKIIGNSIVCPFHAWKFDGDGKCEMIPYAKKIPSRACLIHHHVCEKNGMIFLYYHPEGKSPSHEVNPLGKYPSKQWTSYKIMRWEIMSNIKQVAENASDLAHFTPVHHTRGVREVKDVQISEHFKLAISIDWRIPGFPGQFLTQQKTTFLEPGYFTVEIRQFMEFIIQGFIIPIDFERVETIFAISFKKDINPLLRILLTPIFLKGIRQGFEEDIPIFENIKTPEHPLFCDGDALTIQFKRWYSRFFLS